MIERAPTPLFRAEARHPRAVSAQGAILLIRPLTLGFLTAAGFAVALLVLLFLAFGSYTRRTTLHGQLVPDVGLIKVYSSLPGVIIEKHVTEGQPVRRGDILYVVSSELRSSALGDSQAMVSERAEVRRRSFLADIDKTSVLQKLDRDATRSKLENLQTELANVERQIDLARNIAERAAHAREKYVALGAKGFLSDDQLLERESNLLDRQMRLQSLERDRLGLRRQINEQRALLDEQSTRYDREVADLRRSVASTEAELTQNEARRQLVIAAPFDGVATTVIGEIGQYVDPARPLLSALPRDSALEAHLYAPSSAVGFIKSGDEVYLRYDAFPYQKFGRFRGTVKSVSMSASPAVDFAGVGGLASTGPTAEPLYLVTVTLDNGMVRAFGAALPLRAGMLADADVMHETRQLYEWALEPLMTLTGKVR